MVGLLVFVRTQAAHTSHWNRRRRQTAVRSCVSLYTLFLQRCLVAYKAAQADMIQDNVRSFSHVTCHALPPQGLAFHFVFGLRVA